MTDTRAARVLASIVCLLLTVLIGEGRAKACKPKFEGGASLGRVYWSEAAKVELHSEVVDLTCVRDHGRTRCRWQGRYVYASEAGGPAQAEFAVSTSTAVVSARVLVEGLEQPRLELELEPDTQRVLFELADTRQVVLVAQIEFLLDTDWSDSCLPSAGFVRHRVVPRPEQRLALTVVPADEPHEDAITTVHIQGPRGWNIASPAPASASRHETPQLETQLPSRDFSRVSMTRPTLLHGPFAAAGLGFGPQLRARLRVGYELAKPDFIIYSAAVEGDLVETLLFVPAVEVATPGPYLVIPSVAFGLGVPVQALPEPRAGLRIQSAMQWSYAGLVGNVDIYPATPGGATAVRGSLMIQLSI